MNKKTEVRAFSADMRGHIDILLKNGPNHIAKDVVFEEVNENVSWIEPSLRISFSAGQQLMDDLWRAGIRPTEGAGSAGSLKATENHLSDMRKIAFKQLDMELKQCQ